MALSDHPAYRLIIDHARALGRYMAEQVRTDMAGMDEPMLSGADSGLTSVWQEICAQAQGEESFFWDQYQEVAVGMIGFRVEELPKTEQEMLWLATEAGWDWLYDVVNAGNDPAPVHPGIDTEAVAEWIWTEFLRPLAEDDDHPNVARYLEGGDDERLDEGEEEEELDGEDEGQDEDPEADEDKR